MKAEELITPEMVREMLNYDSDSGIFFWKSRGQHLFVEGEKTAEHQCKVWNSTFAGRQAFTSKTRAGYVQGSLKNKKIYAHRVALAYHNGKWPTGYVDHVNGQKSDNRICNLRVVSSSENLKNSWMRKNNNSGFNGVNWRPKYGKWRAFVASDGVHHHLGVFACFGKAVAARKAANAKMGFTKRHGAVASGTEENG